VLGPAPNWAAIGEAVQRIQYESTSHKVVIDWKDGTRLSYEMPIPNRRGVRGGEGRRETGRVPRVSRLLALAIKFQGLIRSGQVSNYRELADAGHISRARMSQIMRLTELAPQIQEELLFLPKTIRGPDPITEKALRDITRSIDWEWQKKKFAELKARCSR